MTVERPIFTMARAMLDLQCQSNNAAKPDWLENPPPYLRAASQEACEMIEHYGWKWWKKQVPDLPQAVMEVVDISLFYWSDIIIANKGDLDASAQAIESAVTSFQYASKMVVTFDGVDYDIAETDTVRKMELISGLAVARRTSLPLLLSVMQDLGMTFESLFKLYVGKSALHCFRIDNGYKDGSYIKIWSGREDNEYLTDIINRSALDETLYDNVISGLSKDYQKFAK